MLTLCFLSSVAWAEKTFVYCSEAGPSTFNPQLADDGVTFNAASQMIYNRLVEFADGSTKTIPALAEKWEISKDGKSYTFHLRKNVNFQTTEQFKPARTLNADDVLFSFQRALQANHPYHKVNGGNYLYFEGLNLKKLIADIHKVDDYTVRFTLNWAEAPFLADLAMHFAVILSAQYGDQLLKAGTPQKIDLEPVGTGPFQLKRYVKDNTIRYTAHPRYWRGRAKLDSVVFAITPDANVRLQKLKAGECHLMAEPAPQDLKAMGENPKLKVMSQPGANIGYLAFNVEKPPLDNIKIRQAIAHALDRESYLRLVYQGTGVLARSPIPPMVWGQEPAKDEYDFDLKRAQALMNEAGFAKGFTVDLWTLPVSRPYNPNGKKMGELMQSDLAKIGIQVKLVTYDWPTYLAKSRKGEQQMIQMGWTTDNGDPDNFMSILFSCAAIESGGNMSRWCDKDYDKIVLRAKTLTAIKPRSAEYAKAQEFLRRNLPFVPIAHGTVFRAMAKSVQGYTISPMGLDDFYPVDLK